MSIGSTEVLVVDDDEALRGMVSRVLKSAGITARTAASGLEAIELMKGGQEFDAILTDLVMPELDGLGFLAMVRSMNTEVPLIVLTGQPSLESALSSMDCGSFRYLTKPVSNQRLIDVIREATSQYRLSLMRKKALEICRAGGWVLDEMKDVEERFAHALSTLRVAYQPIVRWPAQQVFGYEALVRSGSPSLSNPGLLFEAAERPGKVELLGARIRQVIADELHEAPSDCLIFANVHALDLTSDELYSEQAPLSRHASRVVLEVTERAPLDGIRDLPERTAALRKLGFLIAVDDLGAGYAGLSSFSRLNPDMVKLDMSLVRNIDRSSSKASLVQSMLAVCNRELGIRVICEGVETVAERDALQRLGADLLQGYLFAKPGPGFRGANLFAPPVETSNGAVPRT